MDSVIKAFMGVFFSLLLVMLGYGVLSAAMDARNASAFANGCVQKIESSDYAPSVIESCKNDAKELGYDLSVSMYPGSNGKRIQYGNLQLKYDFSVPFLAVIQKHLIEVDLR